MSKTESKPSEIKAKKCGFVALIGRPNAGKSSLLNSLVGQKIAAVSRMRQTTRHSLRGIVTDGDEQVIFVDTPGLHQGHRGKLMNKFMRQVAEQVSQEVDVIAYLIDGGRGWHEDDTYFIQQLIDLKVSDKVLILATKEDKFKKDEWQRAFTKIEENIAELLGESVQILPCSAKRPDSLNELLEVFAQRIPEGPWLYDAEALSDQSQKFLLAELIQEQVFRQMHDEIPYQCRVIVEAMEEDEKLTRLQAVIFVSQTSQKSMLIGKGGSQIKKIGMEARKNLEKNLGTQVFLDLKVVVEKDWERNPAVLSNYILNLG